MVDLFASFFRGAIEPVVEPDFALAAPSLSSPRGRAPRPPGPGCAGRSSSESTLCTAPSSGFFSRARRRASRCSERAPPSGWPPRAMVSSFVPMPGTSIPAGTDSASPIAGADEVRLSRSKSTSPARTAGPSAATLHAEVRTSQTRPSRSCRNSETICTTRHLRRRSIVRTSAVAHLSISSFTGRFMDVSCVIGADVAPIVSGSTPSLKA
mmetsp:Transcript_55290/g.152235  ORF Transcript_55290/g.152235 Transcript_55290/m.152235 type:complete len:210 (+) Transcript_55290:258-887(+)